MTKIRLVKDQEKNLDQDNSYQDIKIHLENVLRSAKTETAYLNVINQINGLLQNHTFTEEIKNSLRNLRQKAYDRKKKLPVWADGQTQEPFLRAQVQTQSRTHQDSSILTNPRQDLHQDVKNQKFLDQDLDEVLQENFSSIKIFKNLDLESILKKIPALIVFASCALTTLWFVWWQSIPLYESTGFGDPKLCAFGALLMIAGFPVIHAMTRSKIVLLLCLLVSSYEVVLIVNGTVKNETQMSEQVINQNPEVVWLKQQAEHENQNYQKFKTQYENPSSKVFQNPWFKDNYLDPAWKKYSLSQEKLSEKIDRLSSKSSSWDRTGMLKILYRLGLIFLSMISIHHLLNCFKLQEKHLRKKTSFA